MPKYITFVSTLAYFKIALREYITSSHHITFIAILYIITHHSQMTCLALPNDLFSICK